MTISSEQYDRVAKWLDGQDVSLDARELELAGQVREGMSFVGPAFEVAMPSGAVQRAIDSLPKRRPVIIRLVPYFGAAAAAAAAIIVLAVGFAERYSAPRHGAGPVAVVRVKPIAGVPAAGGDAIGLINAYEMPIDVDLDVIAGEIDELQAQMTVPPRMVDTQIDAVQLQVDNLLMEDHCAPRPDEG